MLRVILGDEPDVRLDRDELVGVGDVWVIEVDMVEDVANRPWGLRKNRLRSSDANKDKQTSMSRGFSTMNVSSPSSTANFNMSPISSSTLVNCSAMHEACLRSALT